MSNSSSRFTLGDVLGYCLVAMLLLLAVVDGIRSLSH